MTTAIHPWGILLPEQLLHSRPIAILTAVVAINTVMYVGLAVAKSLPKIDFRALLPRTYQRRETRSIHPDGPL